MDILSKRKLSKQGPWSSTNPDNYYKGFKSSSHYNPLILWRTAVQCSLNRDHIAIADLVFKTMIAIGIGYILTIKLTYLAIKHKADAYGNYLKAKSLKLSLIKQMVSKNIQNFFQSLQTKNCTYENSILHVHKLSTIDYLNSLFTDYTKTI